MPRHNLFVGNNDTKKSTEVIRWKLGCSNALGVDSNGRSGGLGIFWKDDVDFSIVSWSGHHICGDVRGVGGVFGDL